MMRIACIKHHPSWQKSSEHIDLGNPVRMTGITNILTTAFLLQIVMALELFLNLHENVGFEFKFNQTRNTFENYYHWLAYIF